MKKNLKTTRKKDLKQLMLVGVCAVALATSLPTTETAFAQYSYEFTVPEYTEKDIKIITKTVDGKVFFLCPNSDYNDVNDYKANGDVRMLDQNPVVINGRTFVPMRAVFEALGCTVNWDQASRTATVSKDNTTVKLTIGNTIMQVSKNGSNSQVSLDAAPVVINGRTLLPLRAPAEAFGYTVTWEPGGYDRDGTIYIRDSVEQAKADEEADSYAQQEAQREAERKEKEAAEEAAQAEFMKKSEAAIAHLEQLDKQYKSGPALDEATYAQEVVKCINILRSYYNLPAYTVDSGLASAAKIRAKECATSFSHYRPDGTLCTTAIENYGMYGPYGSSGENLARRIPGTDSPADFVIGWWNSEAGHGIHLNSEGNTIVGIGIYKTSEQVYCAGFFSKYNK